MDWWSRAPRYRPRADSGRWSLTSRGRAEFGWCGDSRPLPASELQRRAGRPPHTTHDPHSTKICYRFHPFYGVEVEVIRFLRKSESVILIVKLPGGSQIALPEWMMIPQVCDRLTIGEQPRISIDALIDLRRLIDAQCQISAPKAPGHAESPAGGLDEQQQKSSRLATPAALRGRTDLDRASRIGAGTLSYAVAPAAGKRSKNRRTEAE